MFLFNAHNTHSNSKWILLIFFKEEKFTLLKDSIPFTKDNWNLNLDGTLSSLVEKEMAAHSSILAWRIPGMEEPGGLPSMGSHRVGHDWSDIGAAVGSLEDWCWSWNSSVLATSCKELTYWKRLWCWEGLGAGGERDNRGWDGWMASLTRWTWVWVNSGRWWWTGRPGMLRFMGSQGIGHDWVTELNWTEVDKSIACFIKK